MKLTDKKLANRFHAALFLSISASWLSACQPTSISSSLTNISSLRERSTGGLPRCKPEDDETNYEATRHMDRAKDNAQESWFYLLIEPGFTDIGRIDVVADRFQAKYTSGEIPYVVHGFTCSPSYQDYKTHYNDFVTAYNRYQIKKGDLWRDLFSRATSAVDGLVQAKARLVALGAPGANPTEAQILGAKIDFDRNAEAAKRFVLHDVRFGGPRPFSLLAAPLYARRDAALKLDDIPYSTKTVETFAADAATVQTAPVYGNVEVSFFAVNPDDDSPGLCPISFNSSLNGNHQVTAVPGIWSAWVPAGSHSMTMAVSLSVIDSACQVSMMRVSYWKRIKAR